MSTHSLISEFSVTELEEAAKYAKALTTFEELKCFKKNKQLLSKNRRKISFEKVQLKCSTRKFQV